VRAVKEGSLSIVDKTTFLKKYAMKIERE